ncbi:I78 family peptidase inhibitor (plasmid) [Paracoccus sp. TK19116]|uniref:I78 family peptidase inhibitor n=1 Tax=Paracoccus albicereus TaxID=2922394 RepID=A0ABT1MRB4_9RHOB|nr:I78 family peptidase inhibitor [Paracoccus albicereus]MCQ0969436.1 I78 family peptidase inhibitor [Paracoccus albicereus]
MIRPTLFAIAAFAALAGCMPVPAPAPVPAPMPVPAVEPVMPVTPVSGVAGLEEREPDLCGAKNYTSYLGQPGTLIPTMGISKTYRVVEYRGIEPQEYDPNRIVFRLDASGNIYNVDCG